MEENKVPTLEEVLNQEVGYRWNGTGQNNRPKYGIIPLDLKGRMATSLLRVKTGPIYTANWYNSNASVESRLVDHEYPGPHNYATKFAVAGNGAALLCTYEHERMIYPLMSERLHFKLAVVRIIGEDEGYYGRGYSADIRCDSFEVVKIYDELDSKVSLVEYLDSRNDKDRDAEFWKSMAMKVTYHSTNAVNFFMEPMFFERYKKRLTRSMADNVKIKYALYTAQPDTPDYREAEYWYSTIVIGNKYYLPPEVNHGHVTFSKLAKYTEMLRGAKVSEILKYSATTIATALKINSYSREEIEEFENAFLNNTLGVDGKGIHYGNGLFTEIYRNQKAISAKSVSRIIKILAENSKDEFATNTAISIYNAIVTNPYYGKNGKFLNTLLDYTGTTLGKLLALAFQRAGAIGRSANTYGLMGALKAMIPYVSDDVLLKVFRAVKKEGQIEKVLDNLVGTVMLRTPIVDAFSDYLCLNMHKMSACPSMLQLQFFLDNTDTADLFVGLRENEMTEYNKNELFGTEECRNAIVAAIKKCTKDTQELPNCLYNRWLPVEIIDLIKELIKYEGLIGQGSLARLPNVTVAKYIRNDIPYEMFEKFELPISALLETMICYQDATQEGRNQSFETAWWLLNHRGLDSIWMSNYNTFLPKSTMLFLMQNNKFILTNELIKMKLARIDKITNDGHVLTSAEGDSIEEFYESIIDNVGVISYLDPEVWYILPKHVQSVTKHLVVGF